VRLRVFAFVAAWLLTCGRSQNLGDWWPFVQAVFTHKIGIPAKGVSMTLQDMMKAVEDLSPDEMRQLRQHIEQKERERQPELDMDAIEQVFDDLREGFSEEDLDQLEWAMNVEHIEPADKLE
jgi:hypothetical protein